MEICRGRKSSENTKKNRFLLELSVKRSDFQLSKSSFAFLYFFKSHCGFSNYSFIDLFQLWSILPGLTVNWYLSLAGFVLPPGFQSNSSDPLISVGRRTCRVRLGWDWRYKLAINSHFMFILNLIQWRRQPSLHLRPGIFNLLTYTETVSTTSGKKEIYFYGQLYKYLRLSVKFQVNI